MQIGEEVEGCPPGVRTEDPILDPIGSKAVQRQPRALATVAEVMSVAGIVALKRLLLM